MPATAVSSSSSGYKSSHTGHSRSSFDSYSNDEVSLRFKARNMVFSLMHALNKSAQKQIATPLRLFLFAVELLQLLTFVIEPSLPYWGIEGTSVATVLRYITYVRTIRVDYNAQAAILWIAFAYVVIVLGLSAELAIFSLENGEGSDSRRLKLLSFMTVGVLPVVWVYFVDTLLAFLNCSAFDGDTIVSRFATEHILCDSNRHIAFMGFGFVTLLCLIPIMAVTTLLMHRPQKGGKWGIWDLVNGRVLCLLVFVKAMLVAYLEYMIHIPSGLQGGVYTWLGMILSAILLGYGIYFVPFLKKSANLVWIGVTSACLYGFLFAFAAGNARDVMSPTLVLIGFFVSFIPVSVFVCIVAYYVRLKPLYHWRYDSQKFKTFKRPFEVEICSRLAQQTNVNEDQIINTFTLGMEQYRDDGFLKVAYAMFLLEKKCDFHLLTITLDRARNTHMPFDIKFLVFYIERERLNSTLAMDGGAEEIHKKLLAVKKHSKRARMYIKTFWDVLLKEEDLESLPEIVASVELEEKRANTILQKLREKYPRNVSVLRHYAVFLEKVKNDPEAAHAALRAADEIEEEKAVRHRKKSSLKKSKKTDSVKTSARKTEPPKSPMPIKSPQQQNAEAAQVRFKELISRPYTPALPHSVNADQLDTEALIAQLSIDSNPPSPHDKAIVEANEMTNADYEYYERQKSPIARSRDDIPHPEEDTPDSDEDVEQGHHRNAHHSDGESDKESNVTGSTFSFEQLKSMKRSDLLRYRKYRYLTENSKSNALRKLKIAINLTLLILLVDIVVVFATTQQMMVTFSSSVTGLANAANANYLTHNAALQVQQLRAAVLLKNNVTEKAIRDTLGGRMDHLAELMTQLYQGNDGYEPLTKGWAVEEYNIERWNSGLQQASYLKESLWDAINEFMWMVEQIAISPSSKLTVLAQSTPLKFVLDNGPNEIYRALTNLVNLFVDRNNFYGHSLTVLGSVLISASFVLLCVLIIFLSRPATNEIKSERSEMLRLFLSIPKSSVSAVSKKISAQEDEEHEQANTGDVDEMQEISHSDIREEFYQYNGTTQVPILRSFVMRYFSSMVLIFIGCLVICVLAVTCSTAVANYVSEIKATTQERVLVSRLHAATLNIKFARYDKLSTAPIKQQIISDGLGLLALDYKFRFGSKEDNLPGNIQDDNFLMNIYYGQSCPALANWQLTCDGLQTAFQVLVTNAVSMARLNDTQITYLMNQSDIVGAVDDYYIDPWLKSTRDYFQQQALDNINRTNVAVVVLFILLLPSLVIVNFLLQPIVQRIKDENTRTVKMLLILPFDVIDSIHPIREFLNTGQYNTNKQKQKKSLTSYLGSGDEMMRTIFLGNQEPIIVTSVAGEVDVINPQAEELFGVAKKDVFGKIFTSLLSPNDATKYNHSLQMLKSAALTSEEPKEFLEAKGVCKQEGATEKTFDIQICLSYSKVGGKNLIIHYIRDLTDLKSMEAHAMTQKGAFDIERKKMSDLVYNVFPHSVAEHLLKDSEDKEKVVFAEEYKEVTILFADLVGFTAMCSRLEPALLLLILNGIFSKWDALVDKYGLQKIKTIGDCYMVAGGVPDRTIDHAEKMLDFATEMKEALDTYNTSNNLLMTRGITLSMRVGINTGPVVAGIIGETRMCYDLWGDAVNVASRMESTSVEGRIQVSQSTYNHVKNNYEFEERTAEVKGKGVMLTYLLVGKRFVRSTSGTLLDLRFLKHSMGDPHSPSALSSYERSGSGPVSTSNVSIHIDSPTSNLLNSSTVSTPTSNSNPNTNRNTSNNNNNLTGSLKNSTGSLQATKSGNSLSTSSTSNLKPSTSTNNLK